MRYVIDCGVCRLRPWSLSDKGALVRHANNPKVSRYLRERFPYPYTPAHADEFLRVVNTRDFALAAYAIEVDGAAVGGAGLHSRSDVERHAVELGYWIGEAYWRRGIATATARTLTEEALREESIHRVFAYVFAPNFGSIRVLEKAGFQLEGVLVRAVVKRGVVMDQMIYGVTRDPGLPYHPAARA